MFKYKLQQTANTIVK